MNVVVTGTISFDYIMNFRGLFADRIMPEKIHNLSLSFLVDTLHKQFGGTAGNIAYTLKLLGVEPLILSPAGGKDYSLYERHLRKYKITTKHISYHTHVLTSSYFVMTDRCDNQIGSFYMGATKYAKDLDITKIKRVSFAVLSATDPKAMKRYVRDCISARIPYMYDPAFQIGQMSPGDLSAGIRGSHVFIGNDYEIALIEKILGITHSDLCGTVPVLITTLGNKGSIIESLGKAIHIKPAKPNNTSDPTGAGDAYRSGFLAGYLRKFDLVTCGQMGSVAAVYTVEKYGTQTHVFLKKDFITRYKENYGQSIVL